MVPRDIVAWHLAHLSWMTMSCLRTHTSRSDTPTPAFPGLQAYQRYAGPHGVAPQHCTTDSELIQNCHNEPAVMPSNQLMTAEWLDS